MRAALGSGNEINGFVKEKRRINSAEVIWDSLFLQLFFSLLPEFLSRMPQTAEVGCEECSGSVIPR